MNKFAHYEKFMNTAASLICPACPGVEFGPGRLYKGSPERYVYLFWTVGDGLLYELTVLAHTGAHRGPDLDLARVYGNMGRRSHTLAMTRRLGLPEKSRSRSRFYNGFANPAPFAFELTCREAELPLLAEVAIALAQGRSGAEVGRLPGGKLLLEGDLRPKHPSYVWTVSGWETLAARVAQANKREEKRAKAAQRRSMAGLQSTPEAPTSPGPTCTAKPGDLLTHTAIAAALASRSMSIADLAGKVAEQLGDDPEAHMQGMAEQDQRPLRALLVLDQRVKAGGEVGMEDFFGEVNSRVGRPGRSSAPEGQVKCCDWSAGLETEFHADGFFTAAQHLQRTLGRQGTPGGLVSRGMAASAYCRAHGLEPRRLQKGPHRLTYWPTEALESAEARVPNASAPQADPVRSLAPAQVEVNPARQAMEEQLRTRQGVARVEAELRRQRFARWGARHSRGAL